jgi:hypothetical protein
MQHLVDLDKAHISREIFVNEAIYQQEQEQIFARTWLLVGHEIQIPTPGDYFMSCMGEESVILTRDSQQQLHVVLNTCRHRGMKVCRYDEGNTPVFTCPYHGWNYASAASKGVIARRYPYNYEMGLGLAYPDYGVPGVTTDRIAEQNQRGFYQRWAELMEARSWQALCLRALAKA